MPRRYPGYFNGRKCCVCGSDKTFIKNTGSPLWFNEKTGVNNGRFVCYDCHHGIIRYEKRVCRICGSKDTYIKPDGTPLWYRYYDNKGDWDRKSFLCDKCGIRHDPNSYYNLRKYMAMCRTGNLDKDIEVGIGTLGECVVANVLKIRDCKNCDILDSNFNSHKPCDLIYESKRIEVKSPSFINNYWQAYIGSAHHFDRLFILCFSIDRIHINRVYIVPLSENKLSGEDSIYVYEDFSILSKISKYEWIENYRVDEQIYDNMYNFILSNLRNCPVFKNKKENI